jgi:phospholipid/cholesterol/gamma-HCH transport system substrate-binding protein
VSRSLTRWQAATLGLVVLLAFGLAGWGLFHLGKDFNPWRRTVEVSARFPAAQGVARGTPVRMFGLKAGWVDAVEPPNAADPDRRVTFRLRLDEPYAAHLRADAAADIAADGFLGNRAIDVSPGSADDPLPAGTVLGSRLGPGGSDPVAAALGRAGEVLNAMHANQARLTKEASETLASVKAAADSVNAAAAALNSNQDKLSREASDSLAAIRKAAGTLEGAVRDTQTLVSAGHETIVALKQDADAIKKLPVVSSYVEPSAAELLIRPNFDRSRAVVTEGDLFEAGQCVLTAAGKEKLDSVAVWLNSKEAKVKNSEVIVAGFADPRNSELNPATARALSLKQAEAVVTYLRDRHRVHSLGWVSGRKVVAVGLGFAPPPTAEKEEEPPARVEVILFKPLP